MSLECASSRLHLLPPPSFPLGRRPRLPPGNLQMRKRRRLKLLARLPPPPPPLSLPFDHLFHGLLFAFPSANSLDLVVPALGFACGAAFYFSASRRREEPGEVGGGAGGNDAAVGEWILFSSPTPFNRCVLLRCPSVSFEDGGELLEGVNDRLVREERHYVNLSRGRIVAGRGEAEDAGDGVSYQRLCVGTRDGGVISLDWPENLELARETGLDTTVLLVPGTPEGSMAANVRAFVHEALRHGCFPIVMNPRGCAGSPLTTPRLFTAADSDDVSTAIQFINKSRPWATLMGIGWGYGANMLTKYLTEVGEQTPLTAAVCIDNPFDLNEATKSLSHHNEMDKELTAGLVDILRANKELFQGKNRGFNVSKALCSETVRDFEGAISMISFGFKSVEDFYAKSSTRQLVHRVKIPLLFIQSDNGTIPLFSVPRNSITENPFTSLLLYSCLPSNIMRNERSTIIWFQNLAIEWLSAVELALLKGRHPLLNDVDITITPTKSIAMREGRLSENVNSVGDKIQSVYDSYIRNGRSGVFLKLPNSNAASGFLTDPISTLLEKDDGTAQGKANDSEMLRVDLSNGIEASQESSVGDAGSGKEGDSPADSERSQVLGAATVILNMLDVTMPGTLDDEQKKKVLTATEQGETFMKALQGAVPEDVRGKLMAAVSVIVQAQGNKINIDKLKKIGWVSSIPSSRKSKSQEQPRDVSTVSGPNSIPSADYGKSGANNQERVQGDSVSYHTNDYDAQEKKESSREKSPEASAYAESMSEVEGKQSQSSEAETAGGSPDTNDKVNQNPKVEDRHEDGHVNFGANDLCYNETKKVDVIAEEKMTSSSSNHEESHVSDSSSVEHQQLQKEGNDIQENNNENIQNSKKIEEPSSNHSSGNPPSLSVSQALDALTGFDDSTQMAVNSVFGVIESMIDQLEKETGKKDSEERKDGILKSDDVHKESVATSDDKSDDVVATNASNISFDAIQSGLPQASFLEKLDTEENVVGRDGKKLSHDLHSSDGDAFGRFTGNNISYSNLGKVGRIQSIPLDFSVKPYWGLPYRGYLHNYFSTHMSKSNMKPLDLQSTTDLFLDPEEGRWKMPDQMESSSSIHSIGDHQSINGDEIIQSTLRQTDSEAIIEPSYAILETELPDLGYESGHKTPANNNKEAGSDSSGREELAFLVKDTVLEALKVQVARRLAMPDFKTIDSNIMYDLERVSDAVSHAVIQYRELFLGQKESSSLKFGTIQGQQIIRTISSVVQDTSHLGKVLPVGVIMGSTLACLKRYFHVTVLHDDHQAEADADRPINIQDKHTLVQKDQNINLDASRRGELSTAETSSPSNDSAMVGAVTAALGASALLAHHQRRKAHKSNDSTEISSSHMKVEESSLKLHDKLEEVVQEKAQNNLVSVLAEKAMSVAGPVVPMRNDGEVDHERLVATLAELGQKGGMLKLIGKVALLWGGIRGAMSLTDRLISFLHIAERPLFQRILGFISMVLVMWSPVVIPLLPTLVASWTSKSSTGIAGYACIIGLYVAIMFLVILWGKRIRGYENPLKQYGLDLTTASKVRDFLKGLIGGTMLVLYVHSVNALLGYACLGRPSGIPSSSIRTTVLFKTFGWMLIQTLKGVVMATCVAIVEELLFRSWLPEEIAIDLGYYQSIIISGVLFALLQRSLTSIPGFLFLSLALFGARQRGNGSLLLPIGIRTGIMTANFLVQTGGFSYYRSATPFWLASMHPSRPFDGAVGLGICILLAVFLYPRQHTQREGIPRVT